MGGGGAGRDDEVHLEAYEIGGQTGEPLRLPVGVAPLDDEVLTLDPAELLEALPEALDARRGVPLDPRAGVEKPDPVGLLGWLRMRDREWRQESQRKCRAARPQEGATGPRGRQDARLGDAASRFRWLARSADCVPPLCGQIWKGGAEYSAEAVPHAAVRTA